VIFLNITDRKSSPSSMVPPEALEAKIVNNAIVAEHIKSRNCHLRQCPMCTLIPPKQYVECV
jgi:hypothetical protein